MYLTSHTFPHSSPLQRWMRNTAPLIFRNTTSTTSKFPVCMYLSSWPTLRPSHHKQTKQSISLSLSLTHTHQTRSFETLVSKHCKFFICGSTVFINLTVSSVCWEDDQLSSWCTGAGDLWLINDQQLAPKVIQPHQHDMSRIITTISSHVQSAMVKDGDVDEEEGRPLKLKSVHGQHGSISIPERPPRERERESIRTPGLQMDGPPKLHTIMHTAACESWKGLQSEADETKDQQPNSSRKDEEDACCSVNSLHHQNDETCLNVHFIPQIAKPVFLKVCRRVLCDLGFGFTSLQVFCYVLSTFLFVRAARKNDGTCVVSANDDILMSSDWTRFFDQKN